MSEGALSLSTICEGDLEQQFQALIPALLQRLKHGTKTGVTIKVEFKRIPDTATMVTSSFKITPSFPAIAKSSICTVLGDGKQMVTDAPVQNKPKVVNLFDEKGE